MRVERVGPVSRIHAAPWNADLPGVHASLAFEAVLDQKIHEVASWSGLSAHAAPASVTMPDPSLRASLWTGAMANPFGVHAFASRSWPGQAAEPVPAPGSRRVPPVVGEVPAQPRVTSRAPRAGRPRVVLTIANLQQRLALAEFAEAGIPADARRVDLDDLKAAYRALAMAHHPDRHLGDSGAVAADHASRFARVAAAYHLLVESALPHA